MEIKNAWFEFEVWADGYDENDEIADVHFELNDGTRWCATFITYQALLSLSKENQITGECLSGQYFYADKPIFISKMHKELILSVLKDIIQTQKDLSYIFTRVSD